MVEVVKVAVKTVNPDLLVEQITASLPLVGVGWAGFERAGPRTMDPFVEASRKVGESGGVDDIALRGELRFKFSRALSGPEDTQLDGILSSHTSTDTTSEQNRRVQDEVVLDELITAHQNWQSLSNPQKFVAMRKVLRYVIRKERKAQV